MRLHAACCLVCSLLLTCLTGIRPVAADDSAGLPTRPGRRDVKLWPPIPTEKEPAVPAGGLSINGWNYLAIRTGDPQAGVPWELTVTPTAENPQGWIPGDPLMGLPAVSDPHVMGQYVARVGISKAKSAKPEDLTLPIIRIPEIVWRQRFTSEFDSVVGIHFHEYVSNDFARILYTLHKVPPDGPNGEPPAGFKGKRGSRLEATLLTPVVWSLDQTVVIRDDVQTIPDKARREPITDARAEHEKGHAEVSRSIMVTGMAGPQDWNQEYCTGRRSRLTWYWKREIVGRSWDGYQRDVGKLKTLRTSVALVPPTRWSKLLPIPPERITQRHIDEFNREIVQIGGLLSALDQQAQEEFHSHHGSFEGTAFP